MQPRQLLDRTLTPDGQALELSREAGQFVIRIGGVALMSSAAFGSEQAMATLAAQMLGPRRALRVLVGGLGMGFTLRAALDAFGPDARITVAELMPALVGYGRGVLAHLADSPLDDPRVHLHEGDVRTPIAEGRWDAILLDVDNGPNALTTASNASLYSEVGVARLRDALTPHGVLIVWSVSANAEFAARLRRRGLQCTCERVPARSVGKGGMHTLFVARPKRPNCHSRRMAR